MTSTVLRGDHVRERARRSSRPERGETNPSAHLSRAPTLFPRFGTVASSRTAGLQLSSPYRFRMDKNCVPTMTNLASRNATRLRRPLPDAPSYAPRTTHSAVVA